MTAAQIVNPRTGQRMVFLERSDDLLRIESHNPPTNVREPEHVHPHQESRSLVLAGEIHFTVAGETQVLRAGDEVIVPAGVPHYFWVEGDEEARSIQEFRPALDTQAFFETFFALARDDKLDDRGVPGLLQLAVSVPEFGDEIRLTRPPWALQRVLFGLLRPLALVCGRRARYASSASSQRSSTSVSDHSVPTRASTLRNPTRS